METPSTFHLTAAARHIVAASRAVGVARRDGVDQRQTITIRNALLDLWAALIGHPNDPGLALQHAYAMVLAADAGEPDTSLVVFAGMTAVGEEKA